MRYTVHIIAFSISRFAQRWCFCVVPLTGGTLRCYRTPTTCQTTYINIMCACVSAAKAMI